MTTHSNNVGNNIHYIKNWELMWNNPNKIVTFQNINTIYYH